MFDPPTSWVYFLILFIWWIFGSFSFFTPIERSKFGIFDSLSEPVPRYVRVIWVFAATIKRYAQQILRDVHVSTFTKNLIFSKQELAFKNWDLKGAFFLKKPFQGFLWGLLNGGGHFPHTHRGSQKHNKCSFNRLSQFALQAQDFDLCYTQSKLRNIPNENL